MSCAATQAAITAARLGMSRTANEPGGLVFAGVFYLMVTSVLSGLWFTAATANGGEIVGYTATALVWYVATAEVAVMTLPQRLIEEIGIDIDDGYETELLRPVSPLTLRVASECGRSLPRLGICIACGIVLALIVGGPPAHLGALLLAGPSLVLAIALNLVAQHCFAGAAFWVRDARSTWFLYQKLVFVLGGMLLPLQVLPGWLETVARILPFSSMAYAPARMAAGYVEPELLLIQVGWLVVGVAGAARLYRSGERRLTGVGA
ncbi:MAG: ABC-2 family transporter protein [Actinomycetota bacterium]